MIDRKIRIIFFEFDLSYSFTYFTHIYIRQLAFTTNCTVKSDFMPYNFIYVTNNIVMISS